MGVEERLEGGGEVVVGEVGVVGGFEVGSGGGFDQFKGVADGSWVCADGDLGRR